VYGRHVRKIEEGRRYLINPGSVGQPRDRNPAAAYAIYDAGKRRVLFERVSYDAERTRQKIHRAGLPGMLGDRLLVGA
jgi:diadenosine tetraphosphatase ApaH/serine/threonine PP2A family protein phosphatase